MTVYKPKKSRFYHYDFQYRGRRYTGSTNVETLRKAEEVERKMRADAAMGRYDDQAGMTLDEAAGRWWAEVGSKRASASALEHRLAIVVRLLGPATLLTEITTRRISAAVEKRRGEGYTRAKARPADGPREAVKPKRYELSNATVNADVAKPLRRILNRARRTWEVQGLPEIDWEALLLPEKETDIIVYTADQQRDWLAECDTNTAMVLTLLLTYGFRFGELYFPPDAFIPDGPSLVLNNRKKGSHMVPLRAADARQIAARAGRAKAGGLDTIWFEEDPQGKLQPIKYKALQSRLRQAAKRAGLTGPRLIHGTRHHVGTSLLAETGNLKLTQKALGHRDIKSTLVYAHALDEGLRAAIEARNSPTCALPAEEFPPLLRLTRRTRRRQ
jgi:hypothetical protein